MIIIPNELDLGLTQRTITLVIFIVPYDFVAIVPDISIAHLYDPLLGGDTGDNHMSP